MAVYRRYAFASIIGINLLWATATAGPVSVLSLILRDNAIDIHSIGIIMGTSTVAMFIGTLLSGTAVIRYGPLRVILIAILCTGIALASFEWTTSLTIPALLSRFVQGLGFGLFMTAGISYVQSVVPETNHQYAIGLFSAMAITPYFLAQWEAQYWLDTFGPNGLFLTHALIFVVVLGMALGLWRTEKPVKEKPKGASYKAVLSVPGVYPPYMCMMLNGMLFGFGASFMPILLKDSAILLGVYFTPFAVLTLGARFFLVNRLQKLPKPILLALGMISLALGAIIPMISMGTASIALAGALYGFGYSFIGPTVAVSVGQFFLPAERPRSIALMNTFFQAGSVFAPIAASYAFAAFGLLGLLLFMLMIGVAALVAALVVILPWSQTPVAESKA